MKKGRTCLWLAVFLALLMPSPSSAATVRVEVFHSRNQYPAGKTYPLLFRLKIAKPWTIHGARDEGEGLIPTRLTFPRQSGLTVEDIRFPEPEKRSFSYTKRPLEVYSGTLLVAATLAVGKASPPGKESLTGRLSYQACTADTCLSPETVPIPLTLTIVPPGTTAKVVNEKIFTSLEAVGESPAEIPGIKPGVGLWLTLLGLFLGGLALNLTPCIYPLIPITVSYFGGRAEQKKTHALLHGAFYIIGLSVTNSILGLFAALTGGMLGAALQSTWVLLLVAAIMVALGLSFFGFWEIRVPAGMTRLVSKNHSGYFGTLFMGLTLGIVAAPCLGPFILGLLTYVGQTGDPFLGSLYFFVLSIGMGFPLAVLGIFSSAIHRLPLSGDWMLWVRKLMGWVLIGVAAYILRPLMPGDLWKSGLLAGTAIVAGLHLGWIDRTGKGTVRFLRLKRGVGLVLILGAVVAFTVANVKKEGVQWIHYDREVIAGAAQDGKPVILDFYADWCSPCRAMDGEVFSAREVVALSRSFVMVRIDLTNRLPYQDEVLKRYGVRGVPTVVFLNRKGREERALRVESLVDARTFLEKMRRVLAS